MNTDTQMNQVYSEFEFLSRVRFTHPSLILVLFSEKVRKEKLTVLDSRSTYFPLFITRSEFVTPPLRGNDGIKGMLCITFFMTIISV